MLYSKAKLGCEGCAYEKEIICPAEDDNGYLLPQEQRICYNKEKDEEVILVPCNKEESIYSIEEEV